MALPDRDSGGEAVRPRPPRPRFGGISQGRLRRWGAALCGAYVVFSVLANARDVGRGWIGQPDIVALSRQAARGDYDLPYLLGGIRAKPTFGATFGWWHQTWAGQVPFWRPLTSQFFWLEYHFFSPDRLDRWEWVSLAGHLAFVTLLFLLMRRWTGRTDVAALTVLLFAGSRSLWPLSWLYDALLWTGLDSPAVPANVGLDGWKNQPEQWAGCCILGALLLALGARWAGALACAALAVCFKESGWLTFPLAAAMLWGAGRLGSVPRRVYVAAAAVVLCLVALRASAGPEVFRGYQYGTNGHWPERYETFALGYFPGLLLTHRAAAALLAALGGALLLWRSGPARLRLGLGLAAIVLCSVLAGALHGTGALIGLVGLLDWATELSDVVACAIWLLLAWAVLRDRAGRRVALALVLMGALATTPVAAGAQVSIHVLYLARAFDSALVGLSLMAAWTAARPALAQALSRHRRRAPAGAVSLGEYTS